MQMASRIIVALDFKTYDETMSFVSKVDPSLCRLKIGKALFTRCGPALVKELVDKQYDVFLDLKFHDIPSTVHDACRAALDLGIWMLNVHAQGGMPMLEAANKAREGYEANLIAVTILTSLNESILPTIGLSGTIKENVLRLAHLTYEAGLDGVVCSSQEARLLKETIPQPFQLITPGIRMKGDSQDCQERIMTPEDAFSEGSDYLVMGRSITRQADPVKRLSSIKQ